jgi:hypothetical protein
MHQKQTTEVPAHHSRQLQDASDEYTVQSI